MFNLRTFPVGWISENEWGGTSMVSVDNIIKNVTQRLEQWKEEGILIEKLKEYGFEFPNERTPDKPEDKTPIEIES